MQQDRTKCSLVSMMIIVSKRYTTTGLPKVGDMGSWAHASEARFYFGVQGDRAIYSEKEHPSLAGEPGPIVPA